MIFSPYGKTRTELRSCEAIDTEKDLRATFLFSRLLNLNSKGHFVFQLFMRANCFFSSGSCNSPPRIVKWNLIKNNIVRFYKNLGSLKISRFILNGTSQSLPVSSVDNLVSTVGKIVSIKLDGIHRDNCKAH